ncbi:MAG: hypothetical protein P1U87_17075 [Verrucomicrobiales bacterium]|nr:hypothetical protein [Verrucomicrobiales bacterium]
MKIPGRVPPAALIASVLFLNSIVASSSAVEMTMEERRQSVVNLEQHIEQRKLRVENIADDIRALDERVEAGIEKIVEMVSAIGDSEESRYRVSQLKGDIVSRLRKSIDFYDTQRNNLREQLRKENTSIPRETLQSDLKIFNDRIEKRVEQIETIAASFPESEDLEKYVTTGDSSSFGWFSRENEEISEAWKQNRRDSKQTDSMQKKLLAGLEESIAHLKQRNAYLTEKLNSNTIIDVERELYESDLARNLEVIDLRQNQIKEFLEKKPAELTKLDQSDAHQTELLIRDMVSDLREDFFSIFRKYTELNQERAALESLVVNLDARKKWLAENDK